VGTRTMQLRVLSAVMASIALFLSSSSRDAGAWEFDFQGYFTWEYDAYSQMGSKGFFGPYNTDVADNPLGYGGSRGSAASMNGWMGYEIGQISSGSDMALATIYATFEPQIRLSEAVRIRGAYRIGSWADPLAPTSTGALVRSEYPEGFGAGVQRSFSPGYWNMLWLSAQTPWGIIVVGKRPGPFGCGLQYDAADNADAQGVLLMTSYGPMRFGIGFSPHIFMSPAYFAMADKNANRQVDVAGGMTYDAGGFSFGAGGRYFRFRTGPESATFQGTDDPVNPTGRFGVVPTDTSATHGSINARYTNGTVFANIEATWLFGWTHRQRWLSTASGIVGDGSDRSRFAPDYYEHTRYMAEIGALFGPAKVSFLWAWINGPDRRHGIKIDRQGDLRFLTQLSSVTLFRTYSFLLSYTYGGGNNSITVDSAHGYMTDANCYGVRIDYALASNLNIFGALFTANRISHGYGWGFIRPEYCLTCTPPRFTGAVQYDEADNFTGSNPAIPDGNLGYELDWGFGWKLLEFYTLNCTFGLWQPGKWFRYACIDRSVNNWKTPSAANNFGANPDRAIDALFGMELTLTAEF